MSVVKVKIKKFNNINIYELGYFFICFFLYTPGGLKNYSELLNTLIKWGLFLFCLFYISKAIIKKKYSFSTHNGQMLFGIMLLYFGTVNIYLAPSRIVSELATFFLPAVGVRLLIQQKELMESYFWNALVFYSKMMLLLNFLSTIIFPRGIYISASGATYDRANWLFGSRNNMAVYIILFFVIVYLDDLYKKRIINRQSKFSMKLFVYIFLSMFPVLMCGDNGIGFFEGSSTGIISVSFLCVVCLFLEVIDASKSRLLNQLFDPKIMFVIVIFISIIVILGNFNSNVISMITGIFGKNSTFTGRTYVWTSAINYILKSPVIGYGEVDIVLRRLSFTDVTYVYNGILRILLSYGIVGIGLFALYVLKPFFTLKNGIYQKACACGLCGFFIVGMMNEFEYIFIFTLVFIATSVRKEKASI